MYNNRWGVAILLLAAMVFLPASTSQAQAVTGIEKFQVDLWPEYDQPEMLVIYRGVLSSDTPLPTTVTVRIPVRVGEPHAVAYEDSAGNLLTAPFSVTQAGEWLEVTLETPEPIFHVEFYDVLGRQGDRRDYTLVWSSAYDVGELRVSLLPPASATQVQTAPLLDPVQLDDGALRYAAILGRVPAGQETQVTVSYRGGATPLVGGPQEAARNGDNTALIIGGVAVVALLLVIGGVVWYTRQPDAQAEYVPPATRRPKRSRRESQKSGGSQVSAAGFCTNCGNPYEAQDRFCARCGTPTRKSSPTV